MKNLLITGFEPFGGEKINPSWEAVKLLPSEINGYRLTKLCLPVVFEDATKMAIRMAENISADTILCVGQAGGRAAITPELVAINLRYASIPDNNGNQPIDEAIIPSGSTAYFSTLPMRKMAVAIAEGNLPVQISYSAGAYVCNDLLYGLLDHFNNTTTKVGFIHVPYSSEQGKEPSMELCDIAKGLRVAIENIN